MLRHGSESGLKIISLVLKLHVSIRVIILQKLLDAAWCLSNLVYFLLKLHSQFLAEDFILKLFSLISYVLGRGSDLNQIWIQMCITWLPKQCETGWNAQLIQIRIKFISDSAWKKLAVYYNRWDPEFEPSWSKFVIFIAHKNWGISYNTFTKILA